MKGLVISIASNLYSVLSEGCVYSLLPRGLFKKKQIKPVVGDKVIFDEIKLVITDILERKSYLKRPQIANISQILIIQSITEPEFSFPLFLKYILLAKDINIPVKLIITKMDKPFDTKILDAVKNICLSLQIKLYFSSLNENEDKSDIKNIFKDNISCLIGQSGVGKSSLLNMIDPNFKRREGEYSFALGRGKHETKEVILLPYNNGFVADTPGFSSLYLDMDKEKLANLFFNLFEVENTCKFSNCSHIHEADCEIKRMVKEEKIPVLLYNAYVKIYNDLINERRM